jgi:predicted ATPase
MSITQFTMEEVRCFAERQQFEIRPLTFLVGENSTGKTTVLGCFQVLADYLTERKVDFNQPPYSMGNFKDIVRNSKKKEKAFKLGFTFRGNNEDIEWTVKYIQKKGSVEPIVSSITVKLTDGEIVLETKDEVEGDIRLAFFDKKRNHYHIDCDTDFLNLVPSLVLFHHLRSIEGQSEGANALAKYLKSRENSEDSIFGPWDIWHTISAFSTSPIRSRPKGTYDPMREFYDPEGGDLPMQLMRTGANQKKAWEALRTQLVEFGVSSGLFENIEMKNLGQSLGAPFQLKVKVRGPSSNIVDVGYGVSQILPILVRILNPYVLKGHISFFLLQQPEVHLHPKAQAELSSLLTQLAAQGNQSFIVETHSDNILDRARIEIRDGNIRPEDVSLIYLEPKGRTVQVHNIGFDKMANLIGVPTHYRDFFLKESKRLMGFKD